MNDDINTSFVNKVLILATIGLLLVIAWYTFDILLLIFIGILLALWLDGVSSWISRRTPFSRRVALILLLVGGVAVVGTVGYLGAPYLVDEIEQLESNLPEATEEIRAELEQYQWGRSIIDSMPDNAEVLNSLLSNGQSGAFSRIIGTFSTLVAGVTNTILVLIIALTISLEPSFYVDNFLRVIPVRDRDRACEIISALGESLKEWIAVRLVSVFTTGFLSAIGLLILGVPGAIILGIIAGAFAIIPFIGSFIGAIPGILVAFTVGPLYPLYAAIMYWLVQQIESLVLTPTLQRTAMALPPALTLSVQLILGALVGFVGIALAAPVTVAAIVLVREIYIKDIIEVNHSPDASPV
ncbi:MAG: AI-2E family transporter [Chloroflexi bacterium]|nr:AI-2E family transporter [Chloroflexota bacterium]